MAGKLSRDKGKRFELEVAKALGTERVGTRGKSDADHADVLHTNLFVQCKRREQLPMSLMTWWKETADGASGADKTPMLYLREDRGETLAVMRLGDVVEMLEGNFHWRD